MAKVRGITDLGIFHVLGQPNLNIKIDRAKAARYGLNAGDVNDVMQAALAGAVGDDGAGRRPAVQPHRALDAEVPPRHRRRQAIKVAYQTPAAQTAICR